MAPHMWLVMEEAERTSACRGMTDLASSTSTCASVQQGPRVYVLTKAWPLGAGLEKWRAFPSPPKGWCLEDVSPNHAALHGRMVPLPTARALELHRDAPGQVRADCALHCCGLHGWSWYVLAMDPFYAIPCLYACEIHMMLKIWQSPPLPRLRPWRNMLWCVALVPTPFT